MLRKRAAQPVTTLVPHRSPQLAELLAAAKTGEIKPLRRFLAAGGLPDALVELEFEDESSMPGPLIFSAITAHYMMEQEHPSLELLLQSGASPNAIFKDAQGHENTPLVAACRASCCAAPVRLLLAHGADPALQTSMGEAALHIAATEGRADVCRLLLETNGCDPDVRNCVGVTPLVCAVCLGHLQVVELLQQWGADLSFQRSDGGTLLHIATASDASGQRAMLEYLLCNGLGVNAATQEGVVPMQIALEGASTAIVQLLLEHGANATAVNNRGHSLLTVAVESGHASMVELLLSKWQHQQPACC
jgi:ankyrin repeat protein